MTTLPHSSHAPASPVPASITFAEFTKSDIEQSIPQRFEQQVASHPEKLAVKTQLHTLSYAQLNQFSDSIAHVILAQCGVGEEPVALLLGQGAPLIAAILGVLKSGKTYVPLDPSYPQTRLEFMLGDAGASLIVADESSLTLSERLAVGGRKVLNIDRMERSVSHQNPSLVITPDTPAYIFYTSGSTGKPKGVVDNHRNVLHNIMRYTNSLRICVDDRLTLLQSASFSGSVSSLFCSLLNGATVYPYDMLVQGIGSSLADWLNQEGITIYHSVPVIFRSFLVDDLKFPSIRVIRLEGDAVSKVDVALFKKHFESHCILVNGLGATETGICRQYFIGKDTEVPGGLVPIGYATQDMDALLLNEDCQEVNPGEIGEIGIKSEYLAVGYWRNLELAREKFLHDPVDPHKRIYLTGDMGRMRDDGCLEYLGRKDFGLKIRGQRVEAAEVESALHDLDGVKEAVVLMREDRPGEARLVAYVVPSSKPTPLPGVWRRTLAQKLPDFMVPTAYVVMESMPLNANSKVDRRLLPAPAEVRTVHSVLPPRNEAERQLVTLWEDLLNIRPIGVNENFFDLGGDSLLAVRMLMQAEAIFSKTHLQPSLVFEAQTIEELAVFLQREVIAQHVALVPIQREGSRPPFFCVHGHHGSVLSFGELARLLGNDQPFYGFQSAGLVEGEEAAGDIVEMASTYIAEMRAVQPHGPYFLGGYCFGGVVSFEMANQLAALGESIAFLALIENTPPDFAPLASREAVQRHRRHLKREFLRHHLSEVKKLPIDEQVKYVVEGSSRKLKKFRWSIEHRLYALLRRPLPSRLQSVDRMNQAASKSYTPSTFAGHIDLFIPQEVMHLFSPDPAIDWPLLAAAGIEVHEVKGLKGTMFKEPHVRIVAEKLGAALCRAQLASAQPK
ncbi:MAG: acyl-CoA synthetase (AMP-forming)/AMP-acid ligase [Bacteroidetes bacterium]|nr:acyl-CoA synthetase (AMP-forming)/AMP-acid ligase [Bacteroidota bacterium]